jgi:hypothetical protein
MSTDTTTSANADVFLAPCDPGNFNRTVRSAVNLTEHPDRPKPLADVETARFWGARHGERNTAFFEKMNAGDLVLFYQESRYIGIGIVGRTFWDDEGWVRSTFWGNAMSRGIYLLEDFAEICVPRRKINRLFSYERDYYPQGLSRVADSRVTNRPRAIKLAVERVSM